MTAAELRTLGYRMVYATTISRQAAEAHAATLSGHDTEIVQQGVIWYVYARERQ